MWSQPLMPPPLLGTKTNANTAKSFGFSIISTKEAPFQSLMATWIIRQNLSSLSLLGLVKPTSPLSSLLGDSCFAHHGCMDFLISLYLFQLRTTQKPHELCSSTLSGHGIRLSWGSPILDFLQPLDTLQPT